MRKRQHKKNNKKLNRWDLRKFALQIGKWSGENQPYMAGILKTIKDCNTVAIKIIAGRVRQQSKEEYRDFLKGLSEAGLRGSEAGKRLGIQFRSGGFKEPE